MGIFSQDLIWWITVVDLPAMAGLLLLVWRTRKEAEDGARAVREVMEARSSQLREGLSAFKLEVAKNYASHADLKELENRLVGHLLRIEAKPDATALKAEKLTG
ncbi:MAG: hypothetical protein EOM26_05535 [Alphaproteobacteria bacterium]|nr:hypothetical protein [Alphaproteobacteria bacterium]